MQKTLKIVQCVSLVLFLSVSTSDLFSQSESLFSFEKISDFTKWSTNLKEFDQTDSFSTDGSYSAKLVFDKYDGGSNKWPGISCDLTVSDWTNFAFLAFEVRTVSSGYVELSLRLDDKHGKRFTKNFNLMPDALNRIRFPVHELSIDAAAIMKMILFVRTPDKTTTLCLDNLRLTNVDLKIEYLNIKRTTGFDRRLLIDAAGSFRANWKLTVRSLEGGFSDSSFYDDSDEPRWIYVLPTDGLFQIEVTASRDDQETKRQFLVETPDQDEKRRVSLWQQYSTQRESHYRIDIPDFQDTVFIDAMMNEKEAVQISFLTNFNGTFRIGSESDSVLTSNFRVGYVSTRKPSKANYRINKEGWITDPLLPITDEFEFKTGTIETIFIEFDTKLVTTPKVIYKKLVLDFDGINRSVICRIQIHDVRLPELSLMKTVFSIYESPISQIYPSADVDSMVSKIRELLFDHKIFPNQTRSDRPVTIKEIETVRQLTGGRTWTNLCYLDEKNDWLLSSTDVLDNVVDYLVAQGLEDQYFFYVFDESTKETVQKLKTLVVELKHRFPTIKILSTSQVSLNEDLRASLPEVDIWCPLTSSYEKYPGVTKNNGFSWWYLCINPSPPYGNWFLESELIESRLLFWQSYQYGIEGLLYYCVNRWFSNKTVVEKGNLPLSNWNPESWSDANGDGNLIYPGENEILPSLRLKNIRDGIEDYNLFKLAEKQLTKDNLLASIEKISRSVKDFDRDHVKLKLLRNHILRALTNAD